MSTTTLHRRLRAQMPWLTPQIAGDDDDVLSTLLRRVPPLTTDDAIPALTRPPLTAAPPVLGRTQNPDGFQDWYQQQAKQLGLNPNPDDPQHQYDYRKAFAAGAAPDASGHWPSQFKLPNHPNRYVGGVDTISGMPVLNRRLLAAPDAEPAPIAMPARVSDEQLAEIGAPPMVIRRNGRPTTEFIGEGTPEERLITRRRALEEYQPQKESKKSLALRTILGFVGGGIPGAAETLIGPAGVLDRRGKDRAWQQQELGRADETLGRMRADRRAALQDRLTESQIAENNAQAQRQPQRPAPVFRGRIVDKDEFPGVAAGTEIRQEFDPATGVMKDVLVNGRPVVTRPPRPRTSGAPHPSTRIVAANEFPGIPEGTEIRTIWNGEEYVDQIRAGKPIIATTKPFTETGEDSPKARQERQRKFGAAQRKLGSLVEQEKSAAAEKDKAAAEVGRLQSQLNQLTDESDPVRKEALRQQLSIAQSNFERAQAFYASFGDKKAAAQAEMDENIVESPSLNTTEQRIYDAAKAKNLDPNEAVRRYREGKF